MNSWGAAFNRHKARGCDPSDAAYRADQWESRYRMQAIADRLTGFDRPDDADPRVTAAERMAVAAREED